MSVIELLDLRRAIKEGMAGLRDNVWSGKWAELNLVKIGLFGRSNDRPGKIEGAIE